MKFCKKFIWYNLEEQLEILKDSCIQFDFEPKIKELEKHSFQYIEYVKKKCDEYNIKIPIFHSWVIPDSIIEQGLKFYRECMEICESEILVLHIDENNDLDKLKELIKMFPKVCIENSPPGHHIITPAELKEVSEKLECGICFDTGHALQAGIPLKEFFKLNLDVLHLNDWNGEYDHLPAFTAELKNHKIPYFEGYVVFEVHSKTPEELKENLRIALENSKNYISKNPCEDKSNKE